MSLSGGERRDSTTRNDELAKYMSVWNGGDEINTVAHRAILASLTSMDSNSGDRGVVETRQQNTAQDD